MNLIQLFVGTLFIVFAFVFCEETKGLIDWFLVFSATFNNISAIMVTSVLVVEEAGVPGENHRPW